MQIQCPSCSAKVLADDVNLGTRLAKCRGCNNVFEFSVSPAVAPAAFAPTGPAPRPAKFKVQEREGELEISWRWFNAGFIFLAFFCTAWDAFLVFWYFMAFKTGAPWIFKVFPIAHLAVGVGLTYVTLTGFWNRTTVTVTRSHLRIRHGPIPAPGGRAIPAGDLEQIYAVARPGRNGQPACHLLAKTKAGDEVRLLAGLEDPTQAKFLEQRIETFLGIPDRPIPGQL